MDVPYANINFSLVGRIAMAYAFTIKYCSMLFIKVFREDLRSYCSNLILLFAHNSICNHEIRFLLSLHYNSTNRL